MRIVDLSYPISRETPVFPGDPSVRFGVIRTIADSGYHVSEICMCAHVGTHVDAPCHVIPGERGVDKLPLEVLIGWAEVLDLGEIPPASEITAAHLDPFDGRVEKDARLLLKTGWGKRWGQPGYFEGFPGISEGAAMWLDARGVRLVGVEPPSVSCKSDKEVHKAMLASGTVIIENVANLDQIGADRVFIAALPLNLSGLDGSPMRMVAIEDEIPSPLAGEG